jgi:sterol O-acyltransferase
MEGKHTFVTRASFLDLCDYNSGVFKSDMFGFYMAFTLSTSFYIGIYSCNKYLTEGSLVEVSYFYEMVKDIYLVISMWPLFSLWTYLALILQWLVLKGMPNKLAIIFQHCTQSLMFVFTFYIVITRDWGVSQSLFVSALVLVHFMKMHSYTLTNRDLREKWFVDPNSSKYPHNLTVRNFTYFLVAPTLVYQIDYPKRPYFRKWYFLGKLSLAATQLMFLYIMVVEFIRPVLVKGSEISYIEKVTQLTMPFLLFYIMNFLLVFEQILNIFGELVCFGDREFYQDWWNSTSFGDFARKWNKTVHMFLHKYVYDECHKRYGWSENTSRLVTFLFSAVCHEMVAALTCKGIRPFLFFFQMSQIPMIICQKVVGIRILGLIVFWFGIIMGPPIILSLYAHSHSLV